jgi:hypothetical protein
MASNLNQIKTCLHCVFFDSIRATAAKQSVTMAGFYIDQQLAAQTKAFTYLLWFSRTPQTGRKNPTLLQHRLQAFIWRPRYMGSWGVEIVGCVAF